MTINLFLQVLALALLLLAGVNVGHPRANLGWLGMFCWLLSIVIR